MTAIDKFIRLEAVGWWFEAGRQEAREVIVSFGDETLQIATLKDVPLTHWSLLATARVGTRGEAIIYSADPEQHEVLEIEDPDMIRAISAVTSALTPPPAAQKSRWLWLGLGGALLLGALSQAPSLIYKAAILTTPPARVAEISKTIRNGAGAPCRGWVGTRVLGEFAAALFPEHPTPLMTVIDGLKNPIQALPNGDILISKRALAALSAPDLANAIVISWAHASENGALSGQIKSLGPLGAMRYLVSGRFPAPLPPPVETEITAKDFVLARDHLHTLGVSARGVQTLASANGIGLPLPQPDIGAFRFANYQKLQNICVE